MSDFRQGRLKRRALKAEMKTRLLFAALLVALLGCAVFAYLWIDRSVTLGYALQSVDSGSGAIRNLRRLLESSWGGLPESDVRAMLEAAAARYPDEIVLKEDGGVIWFDNTRFIFEEGKLKSVSRGE